MSNGRDDVRDDVMDRDDAMEQLLRSTMNSHAREIEDGPRWAGTPTKRYSMALAAAAAVIAVLSLAAAFALYQGRSDDSTDAAGPVGHAKKVPLPAAWQKVLSSALRVDGTPATVEALTPSGDPIASVTDGSGTRIVLVSDGTSRTLYRVPDGRRAVGIATDGKYVVLATQLDDPNTSMDTPASTVLTIDLAVPGRGVRDVSTGVPPSGSVAIGTPELLNGTVYFIASPAAEVRAAQPRRLGKGKTAPFSINPPKHGVVVASTITTGRHHVVGKAIRFESDHDGRGVFWKDGGRRADGVPEAVPPFRSIVDTEQRVARNGATWAWDPNNDGRTVRWTDGTTGRAWRVKAADHTSDGRGTVGAVSGPYVFVAPSNGVNPHIYVLDTRTGAYADLGIKADAMIYDDAFRVAGDKVTVNYDADPSDDGQRLQSIVLDLKALPGLSR